MNKIIKFVIIGIAVLLISGCVGTKEGATVTPTATMTPPPTIATPTPVSTPVPTPVITPAVTTPVGLKDLPDQTLRVQARMLKPGVWPGGKYQLTGTKTEITNQVNVPITITAQIVEGDQVLEEKTFTINTQGGTEIFTNEKTHLINSTNVILRLVIQGYNPYEVKFLEVGNL